MINNKYMNSFKFKLVNWLANRFGYEITMVKVRELEKSDESKFGSLKDKTKKYLESKLGKKKKLVPIKVDEKPVMTLRDKLIQCGKL
jgi:hypothetical protein